MESSKTAKEKVNLMLVVAIICVGLMYNANTQFTVLMNSIVGDFFGRGIKLTGAQISMILSLPSLLMIPGVLISGKLAQYISMRTVAVFSWLVFGITGVVLYFSMGSIAAFLTVRALMGFAIGLCQPISRAIPGKLFDGNLRAKVLGYISMGGGILSVIMSILFGQIALTNWRNCLWAFPIIAVIFVILTLLFIPNIPPEKKDEAARLNPDGTKKKQPPFGRPVFMLCLAGFCIYTIGAVVQIKTSVHVAQTGIGGSDYVGYISSANTFGIIFGGLFFGTIYKHLKRWVLPSAALLTAVFYLFYAMTDSFIVMAVSGFFICGISIGILMAFLIARVSFVAPKTRITMAITMVTFANYIGQFITTYYIQAIESIFRAPLVDAGTGPQPLASVSLYSVAAGYALIGIAGAIYIYATRNEDKARVLKG
jgi:MFS family permease